VSTLQTRQVPQVAKNVIEVKRRLLTAKARCAAVKPADRERNRSIFGSPHSHVLQRLSYHFVDREADIALERVGPVSADQIESVIDVRFRK
jgi:hypothetical protein